MILTIVGVFVGCVVAVTLFVLGLSWILGKLLDWLASHQ